VLVKRPSDCLVAAEFVVRALWECGMWDSGVERK